jgi:hypothetical protein
MAIDQILPTSIIINYGGIDNIEIKSYKDADRSLQDLASMIETITHLSVHIIVYSRMLLYGVPTSF